MFFAKSILKISLLLAGTALYAGTAGAAPLPATVPIYASVGAEGPDAADDMQPHLRRAVVNCATAQAPGTVIIDIRRTVYRIHGTNMPDTIGQNVSSGCIRLLNEDVIDLYSRVSVGAKIVVLPARQTVADVARSPAAFMTPVSNGLRRGGIY